MDEPFRLSKTTTAPQAGSDPDTNAAEAMLRGLSRVKVLFKYSLDTVFFPGNPLQVLPLAHSDVLKYIFCDKSYGVNLQVKVDGLICRKRCKYH